MIQLFYQNKLVVVKNASIMSYPFKRTVRGAPKSMVNLRQCIHLTFKIIKTSDPDQPLRDFQS